VPTVDELRIETRCIYCEVTGILTFIAMEEQPEWADEYCRATDCGQRSTSPGDCTYCPIHCAALCRHAKRGGSTSCFENPPLCEIPDHDVIQGETCERHEAVEPPPAVAGGRRREEAPAEEPLPAPAPRMRLGITLERPALPPAATPVVNGAGATRTLLDVIRPKTLTQADDVYRLLIGSRRAS